MVLADSMYQQFPSLQKLGVIISVVLGVFQAWIHIFGRLPHGD